MAFVDGQEVFATDLNDLSITTVETTGNATVGGVLAVTGNSTLGGTVTVSGGKVAFPAAQSASADANTLDDYEEGNWTPAVAFGGGTTGITYDGSTAGRYIKIGKQVIASFNILLTDKGSSTGNATLTGLPFTVEVAHGAGSVLFLSMSGSLSFIAMLPSASATTADLYYVSGSTSMTNLANTEFTNTSRITGTIIYRATA